MVRRWAGVVPVIAVACWFAAGCRPDAPTLDAGDDSTASSDATDATDATDDAPTDAPTMDSGTGSAATGSTGDTGTATTLPAGLYPPAPYDCAAGVPSGPFDVRTLRGVWTTEGLAFDLDGYLVAWDRQTNVVRYDPYGTATVVVPAIGESRGIELLGDGAIAFTAGQLAEVDRLDLATGASTRLATVPFGGLTDLDVAADGTIVTANLSGFAYVVSPDGQSHELGRVIQLYGAGFDVSETRAYFSSYSQSDPWLYTSDLQPDGTWSALARWVELPGVNTLSGIAVDACDNVYTVSSFGCELYRVSAAGVPELLLRLPTAPGSSCPNLAFGRGLGGWDAYKLYVSTYQEVLEVDIGVPGRFRAAGP